ncbi:MAG: hypothetical protein WEA09_06525 [Gemmatimonadota bacterium]
MELTEDGYTSKLVFRGHLDDWGPEFEAGPQNGGYRLRFFLSNRTFSFQASWRDGVIQTDTMPRVEDASRWAPFRFQKE